MLSHVLHCDTNQESTFYIHKPDGSIIQSSSSSSSSSKSKEKEKKKEFGCTWCAKHNSRTQKGHTWKEWKKLKEYKEQNNNKGKKDKKEKKEKKTANVATVSELASPSSTSTTTLSVSTPPLHKRFMFDSGTSSHMTNDIGCFKTFSEHQGTIEIANSKFIHYTGKGTVMLNCELPDGSLSLLHLNNVLFVPMLSKSLLSTPSSSSTNLQEGLTNQNACFRDLWDYFIQNFPTYLDNQEGFLCREFFIVLSSPRASSVPFFYAGGGPTWVLTRVSLSTLYRFHFRFPEGNFSADPPAHTHTHTRAEASTSTLCLQLDSSLDSTFYFQPAGNFLPIGGPGRDRTFQRYFWFLVFVFCLLWVSLIFDYPVYCPLSTQVPFTFYITVKYKIPKYVVKGFTQCQRKGTGHGREGIGYGSSQGLGKKLHRY